MPARAGYTYEQGMIHSPNGVCKPFDQSANGTVFGDGGGAVVLKKFNHAMRDNDQIYAVIKGSRCNNDGRRKSGFIAPSVEGQTEVLEATYAYANALPETIDYIETHGTGTKVGDPIELEGLKVVHQERETKCALGSVKANIGHLHAGAGVAGLIKAVLSIKNKQIPPLTHFERLNREIKNTEELFYFPTKSETWKENPLYPRRAAISSFGVGGTNVHVIIEEAPKNTQKISLEPDRLDIFPLSAKSADALKEMITRFFQHIHSHPNINLQSVSTTLQSGREHFEYRKAVMVSSYKSLLQYDVNGVKDQIAHSGCQRPLILICANNSPISPITLKGKGCFETHENFKKQLDQLLIKHLPEMSSKRILSLNRETTVSEKRLAHFIGYLLQINSLLAVGLVPKEFYGIEDGKYVAAICAQPDHLEEIFVSYLQEIHLYSVNENALPATAKTELITKYEIENKSLHYKPILFSSLWFS